MPSLRIRSIIRGSLLGISRARGNEPAYSITLCPTPIRLYMWHALLGYNGFCCTYCKTLGLTPKFNCSVTWVTTNRLRYSGHPSCVVALYNVWVKHICMHGCMGKRDQVLAGKTLGNSRYGGTWPHSIKGAAGTRGIEHLHVSMPHELKSCPSTSPTHPTICWDFNIAH